MTHRDKAREAYLLSCKGQEKSLRDAWEAGAKFERERYKKFLSEAIDLMDAVRLGEYEPDSFTTQLWRQALEEKRYSEEFDEFRQYRYD